MMTEVIVLPDTARICTAFSLVKIIYETFCNAFVNEVTHSML